MVGALLAAWFVLAACTTGTPEPVSTGPPSTGGEVAEDGRGVTKDVVTRVEDDGVDAVLPQGYGSVTATITSADGGTCEVCLWLADTESLRSSGLMGVTDLGDAVGMAFAWDQPVTSSFFMFQTPTPLSIAWFSASGEYVGEADMEPCLVDDSATCERYGADAPYTVAIEMFAGQLDAIGIGPGSTVVVADVPCA